MCVIKSWKRWQCMSNFMKVLIKIYKKIINPNKLNFNNKKCKNLKNRKYEICQRIMIEKNIPFDKIYIKMFIQIMQIRTHVFDFYNRKVFEFIKTVV